MEISTEQNHVNPKSVRFFVNLDEGKIGRFEISPLLDGTLDSAIERWTRLVAKQEDPD